MSWSLETPQETPRVWEIWKRTVVREFSDWKRLCRWGCSSLRYDNNTVHMTKCMSKFCGWHTTMQYFIVFRHSFHTTIRDASFIHFLTLILYESQGAYPSCFGWEVGYTLDNHKTTIDTHIPTILSIFYIIFGWSDSLFILNDFEKRVYTVLNPAPIVERTAFEHTHPPECKAICLQRCSAAVH